MPIPSTKPSISTYMNMPKPMMPNQTTGRTVALSMVALECIVGNGQRTLRRLVMGMAHVVSDRLRPLAEHLQQVIGAGDEYEQVDGGEHDERRQHAARIH